MFLFLDPIRLEDVKDDFGIERGIDTVEKSVEIVWGEYYEEGD